MAIVFSDAYQALLEYVNRPVGELGFQAKREINNALYWIQRQHEFKRTERLIKVLYPAGTLQLEIAAACDGTPRNYLNFQLLASADDNSGQLLRVREYNAIQQERHDFQNKFLNSEVIAHSTFVSENKGYDVYLINDAVGLYPTPTEDVNLLVNLHVFLPRLTADDDTNFLLEIAYDFVLDKALSRMNMFLKADNRVPVSNDELKLSYEALLQWDSQIRRTCNG